MVAKGDWKVPGPLSLPPGAKKKSALGAGVIVTVAEADLLELVTEVAVTVTVRLPPEGRLLAPGAVNVIVAPLAAALVPELNEPQVDALLPGVQLQITPPFDESFCTAAAMFVTAVIPIVAGGAGWRETEIPAGGGTLMSEWGEETPPQPASAST